MTDASADRDDAVADAMLRLAAERGPGKTICPSEVAREIGGPDPAHWRPLMARVRGAAVAAAKAGRVEIRQSGAPVDPDDFSGIYRIAIRP